MNGSDTSIEITIEELRRRQHEQSTTPDSQRKRCPECESMSVSPRNPKQPVEGPTSDIAAKFVARISTTRW